MYQGIDISNYQTNVDYSRVKYSGIQAAYLKASEGTSYRDVMMATHYNGFKAQGVLVGFYHFFRARSVENAIDQANFFVENTRGYAVDLKYACDVETTEGLGKDLLSSCVKTFIDRVKELTGIDCIVYTGSYFSKNNLTTVLRGTQLWLAHYTTGTPSWNTEIWDTWSGWQYSDSGNVNGIFGNVDMDQYKEDLLVDRSTPPVDPTPPMGQVNGANAVVQNDWFYGRTSTGDIDPGRRVDIGDRIKVIDVSYSRQLDLVEYPIPGGTRQTYIRNVVSNIGYLNAPIRINGYRDVYDRFSGNRIGSVNNENVIVLEDLGNNRLNVVYSTDKGSWTKSGVINR
ncbi:GH25 family lysozyme [Clostridium manihotivorum]|uniref:Lysozyme n=1 Tax=Clostridium manihotivorum TaxID=2320868 RepID=A0A410DVM1_9CLOT|nr:GH25 family lysozyme [Clostridium manihotivorum]QAA33313.1 hypothetical protein C1I91_17595 [Clostridium manihotivorum]